jgi:hypothetical protein
MLAKLFHGWSQLQLHNKNGKKRKSPVLIDFWHENSNKLEKSGFERKNLLNNVFTLRESMFTT